ncbi:MAG: hypothetical protein N2255_00175, partial [Kiritimatiellae bacterium]|nr:hypothetical protein [Kiritimatiellia bacterium]
DVYKRQVMRPDVFLHGDVPEVVVPDTDGVVGQDGGSVLLSEPRFLPQRRFTERWTITGPGIGEPPLPVLHRYEPIFPRSPGFGKGPSSGTNVFVWVSESLRECGFELPKASAKEWDAVGVGTWQVEVFVEVPGEGWPVYAFVVAGTDDVRLNNAVVRSVENARIARPGRPCRGTVIVSRKQG